MDVWPAGRVVLVGTTSRASGLHFWLCNRLGVPPRCVVVQDQPWPRQADNLAQLAAAGDLLVDVAGGADEASVAWCRAAGVRLVSAALLDPGKGENETGSPTCLLGQGVRPGLLGYFLCIALRDVARTLRRRLPEGPQSDDLDGALEAEDFARLAWLAGVHTIHFTERDTQFIPGKFPRRLPDGPSLVSWVPGGSFQGVTVSAEWLSRVADGLEVSANGLVVARPEVVSVAGVGSPPLLDGGPSGRCELGVLVVSRAVGMWWTGSLLDVHEAARLLPGHDVGQVQEAAALMAAVAWASENPEEGTQPPDELPHEELLEAVLPWLACVSEPLRALS